jgi:hypothetical protein
MRKGSKGAARTKADNRLKVRVAFGAAVRIVRNIRKLSVGVVAPLAGLQTAELDAVEDGKRDTTLTELDALAQALGVSAPELLRVMELLLNSSIVDDR